MSDTLRDNLWVDTDFILNDNLGQLWCQLSSIRGYILFGLEWATRRLQPKTKWKTNSVNKYIHPKKMKESKLITLDKTYLKEKFVEYNQLYFNNSLPKVPIFSIVNTPNLAGQYCARWGKKNGVLQIIRHEIQIDENILWTEEKLRSVLVHEMIHYYVEIKKKKPKRDGDFQHWGLFWIMKTKLNWKYNLHIKNREIM